MKLNDDFLRSKIHIQSKCKTQAIGIVEILDSAQTTWANGDLLLGALISILSVIGRYQPR